MRHRSRAARRRAAGFSLIELSFATGLLALTLGAAWHMQQGGQRAFAEAARATARTAKASEALEQVTAELTLVGADQLFPAPDEALGLGEFFYRRVQGVQQGELVWSPLQRLAFERDAAEQDDGLDNDGDGLVDEGRLVLVRGYGEPGETRVVLCSGVAALYEGEFPNGEDDNGNGLVDEPGFHLCLDGDLYRLRLSLLDRTPRGVRVTSVETCLGSRN